MQESADMELVRAYARDNSEEAFAALVSRHVNLVYSVAWRKTGNPTAAEEITQAVFIILARKAAELRPGTVLSGWLYQTARLTSDNFLRTEIRRARREQEAFMQSAAQETEPEGWPQIMPLLDNALGRLGDTDRSAIVLRFFEGRNFSEVGAALGTSEDAAKMRVNRALEKLRKFFTRRGVTSTVAGLATAMSTNSIQAAPPGLAHMVTVIAAAKGVAAGSSTLTLIQGALKLMAWAKAKSAVAFGLAVILAAGTTMTLVLEHRHQPKFRLMPSGLTEYPRSSWVFAGYADPQSALMSYLWTSICQSNRQVFEASLTPGQQSVYQQMLNLNRLVPQLHSEAATVMETFQRADEQWQNGSYRVIDQQEISATQIIIHVIAQGAKLNADRYLKMRKIGDEWKFDGFESRKPPSATG